MTEDQLATAREYEDYHPNSFGFKNTRFLQGFLESLDKNEGLQPQSFDVNQQLRVEPLQACHS